METTSKAIETLNDLIEINNDRVAGFEKASQDLENSDFELQGLFGKLASESRNNVSELTNAVSRHGAEPETGSSTSGAIHRAWIDVKATFGGSDRKSILEECERGEDAIKKAYVSALDPENELSQEEADLVRTQQQGINAGHDQIKALRDSQSPD
ncbi:MAG TPA: PA2169 family four-helix-bundle protein [Mucilaginibacter sp.]|nr:PA2169 family four-helix-bundle protein [Mucilaginibacter sp.]